MLSSASVQDLQIKAFNATCFQRRLPLRIERCALSGARWYRLKDSGTKRLLHLSRFRNVILLLGIAHALEVYEADIGSFVLNHRTDNDPRNAGRSDGVVALCAQ